MIRRLCIAIAIFPLLLALTTPAVAGAAARTIFVDASSSANGDGSSARPFRTLNAALATASPGDVVQVRPGTYPAQTIRDIDGSPGAPITIEGAGDGVVFTDNSYTRRYALLVQNSNHIILRGLTATRALEGVMVQASSHIEIDAVRVTDTGQSGIHIQHGSHDITVKNSFIADTGNSPGSFVFYPDGKGPGEGIYVGSGRSDGADRVWNVEILNNEITRTSHEAIDIKAPSANITIRGNHIHNISTFVSGAVVFHLNYHETADPNILFEGNIINGVTRTSEHQDGNCIVASTAVTIRNNVIANCQHRGIFVQSGFPRQSNNRVQITHNTMFNTGSIGAIHRKAGTNGVFQAVNNLGIDLPGNRSATTDDFVSADQGDFRLVASSGAIDQANPVPGIVTDLAGAARVSGQDADFGAFEYAAPSNSISPGENQSGQPTTTAAPVQPASPSTTSATDSQRPTTTTAPAGTTPPAETQNPAPTQAPPVPTTELPPAAAEVASGSGTTTSATPNAPATTASAPAVAPRGSESVADDQPIEDPTAEAQRPGFDATALNEAERTGAANASEPTDSSDGRDLAPDGEAPPAIAFTDQMEPEDALSAPGDLQTRGPSNNGIKLAIALMTAVAAVAGVGIATTSGTPKTMGGRRKR